MTDARATVIVTQRERFGMTEESLDSLYAHTPDVRLIYVDGNSPERVARYLANAAAERGFTLIREDRFLTPNQARNIAVAAATTDYVVFCDNDIIFSPGWLDRLVACADETGADVVAPLVCEGLPLHEKIHHAGGDYAPGGDKDGFFAKDPKEGRPFDEVMHGHGQAVDAWRENLRRQETGMCEFHCALARRSVFDRIGPLDEKLLSTKEHIDFSMSVKNSGGTVWFEPTSVVTYVFPCRTNPLTPEDWSFFALRWSDAYGRRSLDHFVAKWGIKPAPDYLDWNKRLYVIRRVQGMLMPMMRSVPVVGRSEFLVKAAAWSSVWPERLINAAHVARHDRRAA